MFRSLFGTTVAGEYGDTGTGVRAGNSSGQERAARKGTPSKTAPPGGAASSAKDGGGFFQLEPTHASAGERPKEKGTGLLRSALKLLWCCFGLDVVDDAEQPNLSFVMNIPESLPDSRIASLLLRSSSISSS